MICFFFGFFFPLPMTPERSLKAKALPDNTLKKLPPMHLTFVEREDMQTFFLNFLHELMTAQ